jgi:hypothetical protein
MFYNIKLIAILNLLNLTNSHLKLIELSGFIQPYWAIELLVNQIL